MPASLIRHVDPWQDAARGARYTGKLDADRVPRLAAIAAVSVPLQVSISFRRGRDAKQHDAVEIALEVRGQLELTCQRCLESLKFEPKIHGSVWIVSDEEAARVLKSASEAIVSPHGERLDLATVVEDEVLLALPFAARHPLGICTAHPDGNAQGQWTGGRVDEQCSAKSEPWTRTETPTSGLAGNEDIGKTDGEGDEPRRHPFAVLATLRDNIDDKD